jgi:FtsH-binding integral membrane protein
MLSKLAGNWIYNITLLNLLVASPFIVIFLSLRRQRSPGTSLLSLCLPLLAQMLVVMLIVNGFCLLFFSTMNDLRLLADQMRKVAPYSQWRFLPVGISISGSALFLVSFYVLRDQKKVSGWGKIFLVVLCLIPVCCTILLLVLVPQVDWRVSVRLCLKISFVGWLITAIKLFANTPPRRPRLRLFVKKNEPWVT